jgi:hypothetical protein
VVYVHIDRRRVAVDSRPTFRMVKLSDETTLRELIDAQLADPGLPVAEEGVVWTLTGGGIPFTGNDTAPALGGPGELELARFVYGAHPEHERSVFEVRPGSLDSALVDLPVLNAHRVAALWWEPDAGALDTAG